MRVLVVDDDAELREVVAMILRAEGHEVVEAANGAEALSALDRHRIDVIVLDMLMPVMDGWQFAAAYKDRTGAMKAPIIALTAAADAAKRAHEIEADALVEKPFELAALLEAVTRVQRQREQF